VAQVVGTPSLAATLLAAAGVAPGAGMQPPLPLDGGAGPGSVVSVMRREHHPSVDHPVDSVSIRSGEWRLIEQRQPDYALSLLRLDDGREREVGSDGVETSLLEGLHRAYPMAEQAGTPQRALSEKEEQLLRELGYIR
jgi:hypothetical protein